MTRMMSAIAIGMHLLAACGIDEYAGSENPTLTSQGQCTVTYTHFEAYTDAEYAEIQESILIYLNDNSDAMTAGPTVTEQGVEATGDCSFLRQQVLADVPHRFGYRTRLPE